MTAATNLTEVRVPRTPWWLVLIEGILAIILGILLWMYPVRAFLWVTVFVGFYWIISGIFDIIMIFLDRTAWGWKLFMGIIGILAGGFLVSQVLAGAVTLAIVTVWMIGLGGIFYGLLGLIRAFQGAGWGAGILGVVSIILGIFILTNRWQTALAVPWLFGMLAIFGGFLAIFGAFALRSAQKAAKAREVKVVARVPAATAGAAAAVAAAAPQAEAVAPVEVVSRVESVSLEAAPAAASVVAGVAAVAAETVRETGVTEEAAEVAEEAGDVAEAVEVAEKAEVVAEAAETVEEAEVVAEAVEVVEEAGVAAEAAEVAVEAGVVAEAAEVVEEAGVVAEAAEVVEEAGVVTEAAEVAEEAGVAVKSVEVVEEETAFEIPDVVEIPEDQASTLKHAIEYVEGIGPTYGARLKAIGINTPLDLLRKGATRKGRELIAEASGITLTLILKWVNHADLFRLKGVGSEYAELLEVAGVDTVVELAQRNPVNLHNKMAALNEEKKLVRQLPSAAQVEKWVIEAKQLGRVVTY
jgi:uncharacterized membrane protein HdeD (DUF308 family)/predicted flap endonuclease-1-like 5' DNA nuclease